MDLKTLVFSLLEKGLKDDEIVNKIKDHEEVKGKKAEDILAVLDDAKKDYDLKVALNARKLEEAKKEAKEEAKKEVKELVDSELKSMKAEGLFGAGTSKKIFMGKEVDDREYDSIVEQGKMFKAMIKGDVSSASAISKQIDIENAKAANRSDSNGAGGYAVATPVDNKIHELLYMKSVAMNNFNTEVIVKEDKAYPVMSNIAINWISDQDTAATQSTPTFTQPTVTMYRAGAFSAISNRLITASEADIVQAFINSYSSAFARFTDKQIFIGNITGASDKIDGIAFNSRANIIPTGVNLSALDVGDVTNLLETISDEAGNLKLFGNKKVMHALGLSENTGGSYSFPQFVGGGEFAPLGTPFVENTKITNVLDFTGDDNTGGTETGLFLCDCDNVVVGVGQRTRIDTSSDFLFTKDQITIRGIKDLGYELIQANGNTAQVLKINATA